MRLGRFPSATGALVYRDLLLPLSLAPEHDRIFAIALRLAEPGRARIRLLHVIETIPGLEEGELDAFYASLRERAERALAAWRSALGAQGSRSTPRSASASAVRRSSRRRSSTAAT